MNADFRPAGIARGTPPWGEHFRPRVFRASASVIVVAPPRKRSAEILLRHQETGRYWRRPPRGTPPGAQHSGKGGKRLFALVDDGPEMWRMSVKVPVQRRGIDAFVWIGKSCAFIPHSGTCPPLRNWPETGAAKRLRELQRIMALDIKDAGFVAHNGRRARLRAGWSRSGTRCNRATSWPRIETDKATMEFEAVDEGVMPRFWSRKAPRGVKVGR